MGISSQPRDLERFISAIMATLDNANPTVLSAADLPTRQQKRTLLHLGPESKYSDVVTERPMYISQAFGLDQTLQNDDSAADPIDEQEIYDLISTISDPEHPVSLGQLSVINLPDIQVTPTITHCLLATVIGLGVRVRLEQCLPPNYRIVVRCKENSHSQDDQVNKQLGDRERVAAALENDTLKGVLDKMLETCA